MTQRVTPERATIDFETRSACPIGDCGSWRYSLDPTTEILCMAWRLPYWEDGRTALWIPAFPEYGLEEDYCDDWNAFEELFRWIADGGLVEAHNAFFERGVWVNILEPQGWPEIDPLRWRCSAAKAAAHALPRNLEDAGTALRLKVTKDLEGHKLMKQMCQPRKPVKADRIAWAKQHAPCQTCLGAGRVPSWKKNGQPTLKGARCPLCDGKGYDAKKPVPDMPLLWHCSKEMLFRLGEYCRVDVLAEEAVSHRLEDLSPDETGHYVIDQIINERGFRIDTEGVTKALTLVDAECVDLNAELAEITNGHVQRATQRQRMTDWFGAMGLDLPDTTKDTIAGLLDSKRVFDPKVRRALELVKILGRSSTAKFVTMQDYVCPDERCHGALLYHGASTGRWSGKGVQPQNFVRSEIVDMDLAWEIIKTLDKARIESEVVNKKGRPIGTVMDVLAHALRGIIIPSEGCQLYVADYASIEARVVMWLANDAEALEVFRTGADIYCVLASEIYGYPCNKNDHPKERQVGKEGILGLGFQMGWRKFKERLELVTKQPVEDHFAQKIVEAYREKFWRVKNMWWEQQEAAIKAVQTKRPQKAGRIRWYVDNGFLFCKLPSGRCLAYCEPEIHHKPAPWDEEKMLPVLTFMAVNPFNHQWQRQSTYGGSLVENQTQAVARDLMAEAAWRCEWSGVYTPILTVHDELIAEAPVGHGSVKEFEHLMAECPEWAAGCPVEAEGWAGLRYRK